MPNQILRARDLMQRDVLAVEPHMPLLSVYQMFVAQHIHGAPVIDDGGHVLGVISTIDLLRVIRKELEPGRRIAASKSFWRETSTTKLEPVMIPDYDQLWSLVARDAMSTEIIAVDPELPISDVAQTMLDCEVHRVLVMSEQRVDGMLTTFDLLRALVRPAQAVTDLRRSGYSR
jgi:CBS domain-containing protein